MIRLSRSTSMLALVAGVALFRLDLMMASAHGGHEHAEDGGIQFGGIVDVGVTVGVLVMAYILATWILRYRDQSAMGGSRTVGHAETRSPE